MKDANVCGQLKYFALKENKFLKVLNTRIWLNQSFDLQEF